MTRPFSAPWTVEQTPGGWMPNGQTLVYVYARETKQQAHIAKVLTFDEVRHIAEKVAKLGGAAIGAAMNALVTSYEGRRHGL